VSDPSQRGIVAAGRIAEFRKELDINIENSYLILNRLNGTIPEILQEKIDRLDVPLLGVVPENEELIEFDVSGRPLIELGDESPVYQAIAKILAMII
jgi:CO dehydrogenase maturation factor